MPRVTFIVPCFKLAHLLSDCVNSILKQTFEDFEVLIMDDASPDNTPEVARSFNDERVIHVRNEPNLGHLRNYNKGIGLAKGDFIWLISADDCLRTTDVLRKYVGLMDANPRVGFVFCPAITLKNGEEQGIVPWAVSGTEDFVKPGRDYLSSLLLGNRIAAPSAMARKECYAIEVFPLDMPYSGDWYMWLRFLLHFDVGYFAEPMVYYRIHETNMTWEFMSNRGGLGIRDELRAVFRLRDVAREMGDTATVALCDEHLMIRAVNAVVLARFDPQQPGLSIPELREAVDEGTPETDAADRFFGAAVRRIADRCYWRNDDAGAREFYALARPYAPADLGATVKEALLRLGWVGRSLRSIPAQLSKRPNVNGGASLPQ